MADSQFTKIPDGETLQFKELELLSPWSLPNVISASNDEQKISAQALLYIQQCCEQYKETTVIDDTSNQDMSLKLADHIDKLDAIIQQQSLNLENSQTNLTVAEISDYDRYFAVKHIDTLQLLAALVKALLIAFKAFIELVSNARQLLPELAIAQQLQGYKVYASLLWRSANLQSIPNNEHEY